MNKKSSIAGLLCCLFLCSCQPNTPNSTTQQSSERPTPQANIMVKDMPETLEPKGDVTVDFEDPDALNSTFTNGFWVVSGIVFGDNTGAFNYEGMWYKFKSDGTAILGRWQDKLEVGKWKEYPDREELKIWDMHQLVDNKTEWKYRNITNVLLLLGNTENNNSGTQIKFLRQDELPLKLKDTQ